MNLLFLSLNCVKCGWKCGKWGKSWLKTVEHLWFSYLVTSLPSIGDFALNSRKTNATRLKKRHKENPARGWFFTVMLLLHVRRGKTKTLNCKPPGNAIATGTLTPTSSGLKQAQSHSKKKRTNWTFISQFDRTLGSVRTGRYGAHGQHRAQNVTLGGCSVTFYLHCDEGSSTGAKRRIEFSFCVALRGLFYVKIRIIWRSWQLPLPPLLPPQQTQLLLVPQPLFEQLNSWKCG